MTQWLRLSTAALSIATGVSAQDTVRVHADAPPVWGANVRLVQDFAIGKVDGPPEYAFGSIDYVASRPDGSFYLYDRSGVQIRQYDAAGKFVRLLGRKGAGPGEYLDVLGMGLIDSTLVVWDARGARVSFFAANGNFGRSFTVPRGPMYAGNAFSVDAAGVIYILVSRAQAHAPPSASGAVVATPLETQYLRFRATGEMIDSLIVPPEAPRDNSFFLILPEGGRTNFQVRTVTVPNQAGGLVVGNTGAYRFVSGQGATRLSVERSFRPVPLADDERTEWLAFADEFSRMGRGTKQYAIPRVKPAFLDMMTDRNGRVWVEVYVPAEHIPPSSPGTPGRARLTWREGTTYDVFAPTGAYLGRIVLPHKTTLVAIQGNRLWLQSKGESDEDIISVWHMVGIASR